MTMHLQYEHHGTMVWVREDLKGKHRSFRLCHSCARFKPGQPDNCHIANDTYQNCVRHGLTTPVFECPAFDHRKDRPTSGQVVTLEEAKQDEGLRKELAGAMVMIRSREHGAFWRENCCGYTDQAWQAGAYRFEDAYENTSHCDRSKGIEFVVL
jgi:hypothetical protein